MNKNPLVSVVMPVYNGEDFLLAALESVALQDYPNIEVIVINDGSTDKSADVIASFSDSRPGRIKILEHPDRRRHGIAETYQLGLQHCQGKYIAFLEHDDLWPSNKLSEQVKVLEDFPQVGVVFADVHHCNSEGKVSARPFKTLVNRPPADKPFKATWRLLWGNCVSTFSNMMVRREYLNVNDIIVSPEGFQDWMLLLKLAFRCKFYHCTRTKTFWRQRPDSFSSIMKRMPGYRSTRRLSIRKAVASAVAEKNLFSRYRLAGSFAKVYWYSVIFFLSGFERVAEFLQLRVTSLQGRQSEKTPLTCTFVEKDSQELSGCEKYS